MNKKEFKTLDEQIQILQNKGLIINDVDYAKDVLLRENYFFINGYRHLFIKSQKNKVFIPGTTFEEIYAMFNFDRQIRNILFKNILIVENNAKSIFSYVLSSKYGYKESSYLNPKNFSQARDRVKQVNDLLKKMKRQIRINGGQHTATMHYMNNYGFVPLWIVVKVLSFGIIGEFFTILKYEDQQEIANIYQISVEDLLIYLPILANYRNVCAHEDILYNHRSQRVIPDNKYHDLLNIPKMDSEYIYGKNDLFSLLIILKRMLRKDDFTMLMNEVSYEIDILDGKVDTVSRNKMLDSMGFPENFKELARVE